jgi:hypothetical protein
MMKMKMRPIPTVLASLLFLGASNLAMAADGPAAVATLEKFEGTVMVNKGTGYVTYKGAAPLNEGDSVITLNRSSADIVFRDGCRVQLKANNMLAISLNPGCKAPIVAVNPYTATGAAAASSSMQPLAIAALAGGAVILLANSGNDDKPISGQ